MIYRTNIICRAANRVVKMFYFVLLIFLLFVGQADLLPARTEDEVHLRRLKTLNKHFANDLNNFVDFAKSVQKRSVVNQTEEEKSIGEQLLNRCSACVLLVSIEKKRMGEETHSVDVKSALRWIEHGCVYLEIETAKICTGINNIFGDEIAQVFSKVKLRPEQICGISLPDACTNFHHMNVINKPWSVTIPKESKPSMNKTNNRNYSRIKVLHLSDVHIDMHYVVGSNAVCKEPVCCRQPISVKKSFFKKFEDSIKMEILPQQSTKTEFHFEQKAMQWGDYRNCDLPYWTFEDLLKQLSEKSASEKSPIDYILFTGDIPAHDVWAQTKAQQIEMIYNVTATILRYFPDTPVYPAIGNHDSFPANSFPPNELNVDAQFKIDWLYSTLANAWKPWLSEDALETVRTGGFYSTLVKPGFRMISLNTNFCYSGNVWIWMDNTDPNGMLAWLVEELSKAESKNELVHIIGHVPPGREPECLETWSKNYFKIIERFQNTIAAQFFGHTHYDEVQVFYDTKRRPISVAYVAPSVTPYTGMKPSYRIYDVENCNKNSSWKVLNHQTYVLNLIAANNTNKPVWTREYDACEAFNVSDLSHSNWNKLVLEWLKYVGGETAPVPKTLLRYMKFYLKLHPLVEDGEPVISGYNSEDFVRNLLCDIVNNLHSDVCLQRRKETKK